MTTVKPAPIDVDRILNEGRWTGYQRWLVFLTALTIIFDGFDNQLLGVALPTIMREWSVTRGAFAPVVSLGYLGMMIGGTLAGYAGDRMAGATRCSGAWRCSASPPSSWPWSTT